MNAQQPPEPRIVGVRTVRPRTGARSGMVPRPSRPARWSAAAAVAAALVLSVTACSSSGSGSGGGSATKSDAQTSSTATAACEGKRVTIFQLVDLTGGSGQSPDVGDGLRSAIAAGNASCAGGRPVKLVVCDTKLNPNSSLQCAHEAIADHAVATVGNFPVEGESARTVLNKAGIPDLFSTGVFPSELTGSLSFPLGNQALLTVAGVDAAAGAGAKTYTAVPPDVGAAVAQALALGKTEADKLGLTSKNPVVVPLDATDYSSYVAQAQATGGQAWIAAFTATGMNLFLNALASSGVDLKKTKVTVTGSSVTPQEVAKFGTRLDGLYLFSWVPSVTETTNPAVARYLTDLKKSSATSDPTGGGLAADIAGRAFFQVINKLPTVDPASVANAMKTFILTQPGAPTIDYSKPGFPSDPVLSKFRIFNNEQAYYEVVNGKVTPVTNGFVPLGAKPTFASK
jgi:branched-chain amino acid transport system substrate-binding protein